MFPLHCEFEPVWNLEQPNLKVKPAVFLPYFPAYEMTLNFDTNLDKPHLSTQENRQVVTAYFKSNTSKSDNMPNHYILLKMLQEMGKTMTTTMMMMRMMRIEVMMMILMTLTRTMTLNQRLTTRRK